MSFTKRIFALFAFKDNSYFIEIMGRQQQKRQYFSYCFFGYVRQALRKENLRNKFNSNPAFIFPQSGNISTTNGRVGAIFVHVFVSHKIFPYDNVRSILRRYGHLSRNILILVQDWAEPGPPVLTQVVQGNKLVRLD